MVDKNLSNIPKRNLTEKPFHCQRGMRTQWRMRGLLAYNKGDGKKNSAPYTRWLGHREERLFEPNPRGATSPPECHQGKLPLGHATIVRHLGGTPLGRRRKQ